MSVVSVVIPTVGRPELGRAIQSVRRQAYDGELQVILSIDAAESGVALPNAIVSDVDVIRWTGGGAGGSAARNLGVAAADGEWIAFLDDDDEWLPRKTASQVAAATEVRDRGRDPVVSCTHTQVDARSRHESEPIPKLPYEGGSVADYLFLKRRPAGGRASVYTSTLLCRAELARRVRWDSSLRRHQDWDWLIRVTCDCSVDLIQIDDPLVRVFSGSAGSISASVNWRDSVRWADDVLLANADAQTYVDFLAGQSMRYAIAAKSREGVMTVLERIRAQAVHPSLGPLLIAAGGLIPRRTVEKLMTWVR